MKPKDGEGEQPPEEFVDHTGDHTFQRAWGDARIDDDMVGLGPIEDTRPQSPAQKAHARAARPATDADEFADLERSWWRALAQGDIRALRNLTDPGCIVAGVRGVRHLDLDELEREVGAGRPRIQRVEIGDVSVRRFGPDVALVVYDLREELTVDGRPLARATRQTSTWNHQSGRWLCVAHAEPLPEREQGRRAA